MNQPLEKDRYPFYPKKPPDHFDRRLYLDKLPYESIIEIDVISGMQVIVFSPKKDI